MKNTPADAPLKPRIPNPRQRPASNCFPFPQSACQFCPSWYISTVVISSLHIVVDTGSFCQSAARATRHLPARRERKCAEQLLPARQETCLFLTINCQRLAMIPTSAPNVLATGIHNAYLEMTFSASGTPLLSNTIECDV